MRGPVLCVMPGYMDQVAKTDAHSDRVIWREFHLSSSCCKKRFIDQWLKQQTFIAHSSEGWKVPWSKCQEIQHLVTIPSWFAVSSHGRKRDPLSCVSSYEGHWFHLRGLHPHALINFQRPHLLVWSHWGLGLQLTDLGRTQVFSS